MIKSSKDDRYAIDSVVSLDGVKFPCWALPDLSSFKHNFGVDNYDKLDVIGIDKAQFFEDLYEFCRNAADNDGKIVILAGLDGDYLRNEFSLLLRLLTVLQDEDIKDIEERPLKRICRKDDLREADANGGSKEGTSGGNDVHKTSGSRIGSGY